MDGELNQTLDTVIEAFLSIPKDEKKWIGVQTADWMPIPWFGDMEAYRQSERRIVTVGLNPSPKEFEEASRFDEKVVHSFQQARSVACIRKQDYCTALNSYFKKKPYKRWFGCFTKVLQELGASYYPGASSTALHIDLMSPFPSLVWGKLCANRQEHLSKFGLQFFHRLTEYLKPDIALFVPAPKWLEMANLHVQNKQGSSRVRLVESVPNISLSLQVSQKNVPCFQPADRHQIREIAASYFT